MPKQLTVDAVTKNVVVDTDGLTTIDASNKVVTAAEYSTVTTHIADTNIHVTAEKQTAWDDKYDKPGTGIPLTDISSGIQDSLALADTSLQPTDIIDNMTSAAAGKALSANQGKTLFGYVEQAEQDIENVAETLENHAADYANSHKVTLSQVIAEQGATAAVLGAGLHIYEGGADSGNKLATIGEVESITSGASRAGGPPLAFGVDGVTVLHTDIKGDGATDPINAPYLAQVGDLIGDDAARLTYEVTSIDASGDCTLEQYAQPVADRDGLFYDIRWWYGKYGGVDVRANNARILTPPPQRRK
jgi:hypothetical protein